MGSHVHGRPDNQKENLADILGRGKGDFDMPSDQKWIGVDLPDVEHVMDQTHWSDLPKPVTERKEYELGDEMADHSDDQGWDVDEFI